MKTTVRLIVLVFLFVTATRAAATDVPYLSGRVTDDAGILSDATIRSVTQRLKAHEDKTGNQIAVLTVPSLEGESVEDYANAVFQVWKLGQKGKDNGILILVAPKDRRMRIEVGYGLEGTLPDSAAGSIIRNSITPKFKAGDYNGGIEAGVDAVITVLEGGEAPAGGEQEAAASSSSSSGFHIEAPDMPIAERILMGAFIFGIIGLFTVIGVLTPGTGWFLYFFLIPFWAMFPIIIVGTNGALVMLITYLVAFPVVKLLLGRTAWYNKARTDLKTKGSANIGGFMVTSGGSGGSWSSGGSSGGGFSGGGGSSGGGGASGSW